MLKLSIRSTNQGVTIVVVCDYHVSFFCESVVLFECCFFRTLKAEDI